MKKITFLFAILLLIFIGNLNSQSDLIVSPGRLLDTVQDSYGNKFHYSNLSLSSTKVIGSGGTTTISAAPTQSCQAGKFIAHFAPGSLFANSTAAQTIICQVLQDISGLIISPPTITANPIHILCNNQSGGIATAGSIYLYPNFPLNPNQGVIYSQVEKALKYGVNPYLNFPIVIFPQNNTMYYGYIDVNPNLNWNYNTNSVNINSSKFDFYTAMLHEVTHLLGFQSLLSNTGFSKLGAANNYFTKYDTYLKDNSGSPVLSAPTTSCYASNLTYALNTTTMLGTTTGNPVDITVCSNALKYVSTTNPNPGIHVFTPAVYSQASSFHHFEDMCSPAGFSSACTPTPNSPGYNDLYFVMSNSVNTGSCYVKRYLKEEEKNVLCDLGYSVASTYTSSTATGATVVIDGNNSFKTYSGGACNPALTIYGANDGISNGIYNYISTTNSYVLPLANLLTNDLPSGVLSVSCVELITNNASIITGGTNITITANSVGVGLVVLKYLPVHVSGQLGNPTYVFINFVQPGCTPSGSCDFVENGSFENYPSTGCGIMMPGFTGNLYCFKDYLSGPSILIAGCTSTSGYDLGTNTMGYSPAINSHNGTSINKCVVGLKKYFGSNTNTSDAIKTPLTNPLVPGQTYQVSLWILNRANSANSPANWNPTNDPCVISIAGHNAYNILPNVIFPNGLTPLTDFTVTASGTWAQFTSVFTVPSNLTSNLNTLLIGFDHLKTNGMSSLGSSDYIACFIDDISLMPNPSPTLALPSTQVCLNTSIANLQQYGSVVGTFTGNGVTYSGGQYHFNSPPILGAGTHTISYTYTLGTGCSATQIHSITIVSNSTLCCTQSAYSAVTPSVISTNATFSGPLFVAQDVTVSPSNQLNITGEIKFAPNVKIVIENGAGLVISNAHLLACGSDMWDGIIVKNGGNITANGIGGNNLIEDAKIAISLPNTSSASFVGNVLLSGTTFNKNYISLSISNYSLPPSSPQQVHISECVFTCRDLPFTLTSWPQTGTVNTTASSNADLRTAILPITGLAPPFMAQNGYPIMNLKNPYSNQTSQTAIQLINVGNTTGNATNSVNIGHPFNTAYFNLFDAHNIGIYALNSNLASFNNVFQNLQNLNTPGVGIKAINNFGNGFVYNSLLTLNLPAALNPNNTSGMSINRFYNCNIGIEAINQAWLYAQYAEFKSTQTPTFNTVGVFGIYENSNRYLEHQILDSKFLNLKTGVFCNFGINSIVETPSPYGQMWGTFNVKRNLFAPTTQSVISNNEYLGTGVHFQNIINLNSPQAMPYPGVTYTTTGLNIMDNTFDRVYRGATVLNFGTDSHIKTTANNTITILPDFSLASQWGVNHTHNYHSVVNSNIVTGYTIGLTSDLRGVYNADNAVSSARCNSVVNLPIGMEFGGTNVGMIWRQNTMLTNSRGLQLSNTGAIGGISQQGDATNPSDNYWQSATSSDWTGRYHTYTDANSWASNSHLYVRAISGFTPINNSSAGSTPQQYDNASLFVSNSETIIPCYTLPEHEFDEYGMSYQALQIVLTGSPEEDEQEVSQYLLFFALDQDTNIVMNNDTIHEFYNSNISSALGLVREIEDLLATGQFTDANTSISNFSPASNIESNYKSFFELYYSYITTNSLSTGALSDLEVLAMQCPFKDGPAVYKARALYDLITKSIIIYDDKECLSSGYSARPAKFDSSELNLKTILLEHETTQIKFKSKLSFMIYPNPANDVFYINTKSKSNELYIRIKDITGRILYSKSISNLINSASVGIILPDGIYLVSITDQNGFSQTKKLIISK
jgi:hypothetical protein